MNMTCFTQLPAHNPPIESWYTDYSYEDPDTEAALCELQAQGLLFTTGFPL